MTHLPLTLTLKPTDSDALSEPELDALTRALARQLDSPELTESVQLPEAGPLEPGAKGLRSAVGKLVLAVAPDTAPALVGFLKDWITRDQRVKLKVQVGDRLIEGDFDPRSTDPAELEALAGRLLERLGG